MWSILGRKGALDLEPSVPLNGNVYLGCEQHNIEVPHELVAEKRAMFKDLLKAEGHFLEASGDALHNIHAWEYDMHGHAEQVVERYLELANNEKYHSSMWRHLVSTITL